MIDMRRTEIFAYGLAALALFSCTGEKKTEETPLLLSPSSSVCLTTKAPLSGGTLPDDRNIVLSACLHPADKSGKISNYFTEAVFRKGRTGLWQSVYFWPSGGTLSMLGYSAGAQQISPHWNESDVSESVSFHLGDNSSLQDDVLAGCAGKAGKCPFLNFRMSHVYALLTFKGRSDEDYDRAANTGVTLNGIAIREAFFSGDVELRRSGNEVEVFWSDRGTCKDRMISDIPMTNLNADISPTVGVPLLVVPSGQKPVTIWYTLHMGYDPEGNALNRDLEHTVMPEGEWRAGYATNYTICITARRISVEATVSEWNDLHETMEF